jgi:hypothetical protein
MTLVRRKALEISGWVTWLASPGCKEWAQGLEREVAFIDSDWRALGWALGSMRVLLDRREAPLRSIFEVPAVAKKYFEKRRSQIALTYLMCSIYGIGLSLVVFTVLSIHRYPMDCLSTCLIVMASSPMFYRTWRYGRVVVVQPDNVIDCAVYLRSEMQQDIEFNCGWPTWASFALIWFSFALADLGAKGSNAAWVHDSRLSLPMLTPLINIHFHRQKLECRIDELTTLIATGIEGARL